MIELQLSIDFSCAHFYAQTKWSPEKNLASFGKCYSKYGHGHDYRLQVIVQGNLEDLPQTEKALETILNDIQSEFDHKHLNFELAEFYQLVPTTENISSVILHKLRAKNSTLKISRVRLFERPDLFVDTFNQ